MPERREGRKEKGVRGWEMGLHLLLPYILPPQPKFLGRSKDLGVRNLDLRREIAEPTKVPSPKERARGTSGVGRRQEGGKT